MELVKEKVAYLKGLAEGLKVGEESSEGKLILAMIDVLDEIAEEMYDLFEAQDELSEYVEELDEDLSDLEDEFYDEDEYDDDEEDEDEEDDDAFYEVQCPNCNDSIVVDEEIFINEDAIICPNCKTEITFEVDDCDCGDCGCGHEHE